MIEFNKNYVGDSDKIVKDLIKQEIKFDLILTDPPYNLNKDFGNNSDCLSLKDFLKVTKKRVNLYKDVLMSDQINKPDSLVKLLQALAFQVGSQVSYNELAQLCNLDSKTVEKYVILLEQSYVIFRLNSFSRNLRNELKTSKKIYFYDNGIRNALIANFNQIEGRADRGALWENFLISERKKFLEYNRLWGNSWFWRTKEQKEIDLVEERDGKITGYEFKWNPDQKVKIPRLFLDSYENSDFQVIHRDNCDSFLLEY